MNRKEFLELAERIAGWPLSEDYANWLAEFELPGELDRLFVHYPAMRLDELCAKLDENLPPSERKRVELQIEARMHRLFPFPSGSGNGTVRIVNRRGGDVHP